MSGPSSGGALYLIVIQVISRGFTFLGNQVLLRYLSPSHLGLAIQLEALSVSILYTARESLRVALQREPRRTAVDNNLAQSTVNAGYLVVILGVFLSFSCMPLYASNASEEVINSRDFNRAFLAYVIATGIELASEPCFLVIQQHALFRDRARAETTAAITRCVSACATAAWMRSRNHQMSVLPFAVGQVCYATSLLLVYVYSANKISQQEKTSIWPRRIIADDTQSQKFYLSKPLLKLAGAFYGQSIFKWLLTQGDTLVLSLFANLQAQGIFALASNYGSLLSRLLFQPIEESSRNVFGRLLSSTGTHTTQQNPSSKRPSAKRHGSTASIHSVNAALAHLTTTLHAYTLLIALPAVTVLPTLFPLVIQIFLGQNSSWASQSTFDLLSSYAYYIPLLAVNGLLDAFVTSVASEAELGIQSLMMVGVTAIYLCAAWVGLRVLDLGGVGLVYANCLGMCLRIAFSLFFIRQWLIGNAANAEERFRQLVAQSLPSWSCLGVGAGVAVMLQSKEMIKDFVPTLLERDLPLLKGVSLQDAGLLVSGAVLIASTMLASEAEFLVGLVEPLVPQRFKFAVDRIKGVLGVDQKAKSS